MLMLEQLAESDPSAASGGGRAPDRFDPPFFGCGPNPGDVVIICVCQIFY